MEFQIGDKVRPAQTKESAWITWWVKLVEDRPIGTVVEHRKGEDKKDNPFRVHWGPGYGFGDTEHGNHPAKHLVLVEQPITDPGKACLRPCDCPNLAFFDHNKNCPNYRHTRKRINKFGY